MAAPQSTRLLCLQLNCHCLPFLTLYPFHPTHSHSQYHPHRCSISFASSHRVNRQTRVLRFTLLLRLPVGTGLQPFLWLALKLPASPKREAAINVLAESKTLSMNSSSSSSGTTSASGSPHRPLIYGRGGAGAGTATSPNSSGGIATLLPRSPSATAMLAHPPHPSSSPSQAHLSSAQLGDGLPIPPLERVRSLSRNLVPPPLSGNTSPTTRPDRASTYSQAPRPSIRSARIKQARPSTAPGPRADMSMTPAFSSSSSSTTSTGGGSLNHRPSWSSSGWAQQGKAALGFGNASGSSTSNSSSSQIRSQEAMAAAAAASAARRGSLPDIHAHTPTKRSASASRSTPRPSSAAPAVSWSTISAPEDPSLDNQPLPVRLGLVPPFPAQDDQGEGSYIAAPARHRGEPGIAGSRYVDGYYLHVPPPLLQQGSSAVRSSGSVFTADGSTSSTLNVLGSDSSSSSSATSLTPPEILSPTMDRSRSLKRPSARPLQHSRSTEAISPVGLSDGGSQTTLRSGRWELEDYWQYRIHTNASGGKRKIRHHAFPREKVPYFLAHCENQTASDLLLHNATWDIISQRQSIIPFGDRPPLRVLDIGTGCGVWCIDAAKDWPKAEFIGLDVVPCQTDLSNLKDPDLSRRISWVVADFLEELPFPTGSFDLVHVRYVGAPSIPEDRWSDFFSELTRVLKPDGHLELLERNYNFFGNVENLSIPELIRLSFGSQAPSVAAAAVAATATPSADIPQPAKRFKALGDGMDRVLARRFLNRNILSHIPSALTNQDFGSLQTGVPRRIPILCNPRHRPLVEEVAYKKTTDPSKLWQERPQIGAPLENSGFNPGHLNVFRAALMFSKAAGYLAASDRLWEESEDEKIRLMSRSWGGPRGSPNRPAEDVSEVTWAHPWKNRVEFDNEMNELYQLLVQGSNMGDFLKQFFGWKEGNLLSVEERKTEERRQKMRAGSTVSVDNGLLMVGSGVEMGPSPSDASSHSYNASSSPIPAAGPADRPQTSSPGGSPQPKRLHQLQIPPPVKEEEGSPHSSTSTSPPGSATSNGTLPTLSASMASLAANKPAVVQAGALSTEQTAPATSASTPRHPSGSFSPRKESISSNASSQGSNISKDGSSFASGPTSPANVRPRSDSTPPTSTENSPDQFSMPLCPDSASSTSLHTAKGSSTAPHVYSFDGSGPVSSSSALHLAAPALPSFATKMSSSPSTTSYQAPASFAIGPSPSSMGEDVVSNRYEDGHHGSMTGQSNLLFQNHSIQLPHVDPNFDPIAAGYIPVFGFMETTGFVGKMRGSGSMADLGRQASRKSSVLGALNAK